MATWYIARVQLIDVKEDHASYTSLHTAMKAAGFFTQFTDEVRGKKMLIDLPHAEYLMPKDGTDAKAVISLAKAAADGVHKPGCRILSRDRQTRVATRDINWSSRPSRPESVRWTELQSLLSR
jgi:hypothetical protein